MKPIRILITEDDPMVSFIVGRIVHSLGDFLVVGQAATGAEALAQIQSHTVDLVLLDLFLPGKHGDQALAELRAQRFPVDVIVITAATDRSRALDALRLGAWDYVVKPFSYDRLRIALETYRDAFRYRENLPPQLTQDHLDRLFYPEGREFLSSLGTLAHRGDMTDRILEILNQESESMAAGEVAEKLGVSRITVRKYCEALVSAGRLVSKNHYQSKGRPIKKYQVLD
ncbi:response regulator [Aminomonas paucivorans]|uniref:Transcriptional regulatory protein n=1 Tax=Aminomonas paucivorans DSM 12260 TaxID=584708 RepID=E3CYX9_9BACT|nr:response regulator [Aminomonas paucivorans]EFQ24574.1 response regulator receiver and unknown domain protein [Aminomonas paucivorans DSM 12260]